MTAMRIRRAPRPPSCTPLCYDTADEIVRMRVTDGHARERRQIARQQIDAVIDQQTAVDLRRLSGETTLEQMLGLLARAGDDRVEALADLRSIARQRNLLLQLHELRATAFGGLARRDLIHLRRRRE